MRLSARLSLRVAGNSPSRPSRLLPRLLPRDRTAAPRAPASPDRGGPLALRCSRRCRSTSGAASPESAAAGASPLEVLIRCRALGVSPIVEVAGLSSPACALCLRIVSPAAVTSPECFSGPPFRRYEAERNPGTEAGVRLLVLNDGRRGVQVSACSLSGALAETRRFGGEGGEVPDGCATSGGSPANRAWANRAGGLRAPTSGETTLFGELLAIVPT